jgi:hypothetical protein
VDLGGRERRIALEILFYLVKHPDAKDSLAGIRLWWLDEPDKWTFDELHRAADALVRRGTLQSWDSGLDARVFGPSEQFLENPEEFIREYRPIT